MPKKRVAVSGQRQIITYAYLYLCARHTLEQAENSERGQTYNCMSTIMFCAFTIEAYMNHIGEGVIDYWRLLERLKPMEKLEVLSRHIPFTIDVSCRPFQSFSLIFKFRNALAHGKTVRLSVEDTQEVYEDDRVELPETDWEKFCTLNDAMRLFVDTGVMITEIHKAAGHGDQPFASLGWGSWRASPLDRPS